MTIAPHRIDHASTSSPTLLSSKTVIRHKIAARVVCVFSEQDAHVAARAEQHQHLLQPRSRSATAASRLLARANLLNLQNLVARDEHISAQLREEAQTLQDIKLTERQLCDLELIINGGFSPLEGFLNESDYKSVVDTLRLADGTLFPIPITLDVSHEDIEQLSIKPGVRLALRDPRDDEALAIITVEDIYKPDHVKEAVEVFGADDPAHPAVAYLRNRVHDFYIGGKVQAIQAPTHSSSPPEPATSIKFGHSTMTLTASAQWFPMS